MTGSHSSRAVVWLGGGDHCWLAGVFFYIVSELVACGKYHCVNESRHDAWKVMDSMGPGRAQAYRWHGLDGSQPM